METVVVTGGCGVLGRFVVRQLCDSAKVAEVRVVDRSDARPESHSKLRYFKCELTDDDVAAGLDQALQGATAVVHAAKADIPVTYQSTHSAAQMWRDNVEATERLIERMIARKIRRLVYVGDAYSALPVDDNFGLAEDHHRSIPPSFLLGEWGESRCRAELLARRAAKKDNALDALFLRPTFIHSEYPSSFWTNLLSALENDKLPFTPGERRGLHQFVYAGNLAVAIENAIFQLKKEPAKFANELVYINDDTRGIIFLEFLRQRAGKAFPSKPTNYWPEFAKNASKYLAHNAGWSFEGHLNFVTWRALCEKNIGFSDKKARLLLGYRPQLPHKEALQRSLRMLQSSHDASNQGHLLLEVSNCSLLSRKPSFRRFAQA